MLQDLDPKLIDALEELRREFDDKLTRQRESFEQLLATRPAEPAAHVEPAFEPAPAPVAELDPLGELKLATAEIDRAQSQADILDALVRSASRFASRTALFLNREGSLVGWGASGFGDRDATVKDLQLSYAPGSAWEQVTMNVGGLGLEAAECATLAEQLGVQSADIGVLIPFILGNEVAAVVYSDRGGGGGAFEIAGLQLLSYLASQTLETLPVRNRSATSSLHLAVADPSISKPRPDVVVESVPEPEFQPAPEPEPEAEFQPEPEAEFQPEPEAEFQPEPEAEFQSPAELAPEVWDESETESPPQDLAEVPYEAPTAELPEAPAPPPSQFEATEGPSFDASLLDSVAPSVDEVDMPREVSSVEETTSPGLAPAEFGPAPAPTVEVPPEGEPPGPLSTQVMPPQDVEGPGWAFTTTRIPTAAGTEALHEEARRLARLLVTEIKLYNEELVEDGRQAGDVYSRLREDIDRSRQIFDDRIDPEVRSEKDYFREALVRILAGGDASILGA